MAQKTIQIADKPTLDAAKGLLENSGYGLKAIKNAITSSLGGSGVEGIQIGKIVNECASGHESVSTLPYSFWQGSAVIYNNEIHILGGNSGNYKKHYKFNGSSWVNVSTLPYDFCAGSAVVYNNEIHILGSESNYTNHYKFNGSSWVNVSTLPYNFRYGSAVVYKNEIHILGSGYYNSYGSTTDEKYPHAKKHYKYNGSSWVSVSTLPYDFYNGSAVVYNNEIHILGGKYYNSNGSTTDEQYPYSKNHYKFGGSLWKQTYTLPYSFYNGSAIVYNNELHILGTSSGSGGNHYSIKNDYHYITTMLTKGIHILLSNNENIIYTNNATKIASNIAKVTETGTVEIIAEFPDSDNTQPFLTFY